MAQMALGQDFAERPVKGQICATPRPALWTGRAGGLQ